MQDLLRLDDFCETDIPDLMTWFSDETDTQAWGGPRFRHPYTYDSFKEDMHWGRMATYGLRCDARGMVAFGQLYPRFERINLARLAVHPEFRGQGIGTALVEQLMQVGRTEWSLPEYSLFVYTDNARAIACYERAGFRSTNFPDGAPMQDVCIYMTRSVHTEETT